MLQASGYPPADVSPPRNPFGNDTFGAEPAPLPARRNPAADAAPPRNPFGDEAADFGGAFLG